MIPAVPASPHGGLTAMVPDMRPLREQVMAQRIRHDIAARAVVDDLPEAPADKRYWVHGMSLSVVGLTMTACYDANEEAPRDGCACRACYREREKRIPTELVRLVQEDWSSDKTYQLPGPAIWALRKALQFYAMGTVSYDEMLVALVKSLIEQNNRQFRDLCSAAALKPIVLTAVGAES